MTPTSVTTTVTPLHDCFLVRRVEENDTVLGGIIIPDSAKEKPQSCEVIAVGKGKSNGEGKVFPLDVKAGDRVLFGKYSGTEIRIDGGAVVVAKVLKSKDQHHIYNALTGVFEDLVKTGVICRMLPQSPAFFSPLKLWSSNSPNRRPQRRPAATTAWATVTRLTNTLASRCQRIVLRKGGQSKVAYIRMMADFPAA